MTRKQAKMFEEMHKDLRFIRYEMKVNGSVGLEGILSSHDKSIKETTRDVASLRDRSEIVWRTTEALRAKAEFWRSWKRLVEKSPFLSFIGNVLSHKIVTYFILGFVLFSVLLMLGFSMGDAIERVLQFISKTK